MVQGQQKVPRYLFQGFWPIERKALPVDVLAGVTLAALAIPEVMGYTSIAGMPVITGLYTILLPVLAFAILGSSRHLVVGADSATAAVMAAGLASMAVAGSPSYVALAAASALLVAILLLIARLIGLAFIADFLSRTVLVGFLTGVGIQVAAGQVAGVLGYSEGKGVVIAGHDFSGTLGKLASTLSNLSAVSWPTVAVSASVLTIIIVTKLWLKKIPGALVAVIGSIIVSEVFNLSSHGVATLGPVPGGLPHLALPKVGISHYPALFATSISMFVLIIAQSAATSRAYAAKSNEALDENLDLVGLSGANLAASLTGTFVVNGSPTKTEMVGDAGGRSQVAQLTTGVLVAIVLLFLTKPLQYMPHAVLSSVVLLIGIELIDLKGLHRIAQVRTDEFVVAVLTAATVVLLGVEQGIVLAIVASILIHVRRSYHPVISVLEQRSDQTWKGSPLAPTLRTMEGVAVVRFASSLYYANANALLAAATELLTSTPPLRVLCLDLSAVSDIDYTGAQVLRQVQQSCAEHQVTLQFAEPLSLVHGELERYGLLDLIGTENLFDSVEGAVIAARSAAPAPPASEAPPNPS